MQRNRQLRPHPVFAEERVLAVLKPAELMRLELLRSLLKQVFPRLEIVCPEDLERLHTLLRRCQATHPLLLALGGDGTLHQVLQWLDLDRQALGLLPLGTGNDFARTIGYPARVRDKVARLSELAPIPTDFGEMCGQRFINSAGFGLDSDTLAVRVHHPNNRLLQNYNLAFISVLAKLQPAIAEIEIDGERFSGKYYWILAMNNRDIGGGTRIAPQALIDDGMLDFLLVSAESKFEMLRNLPAAIRGKHLGMKQVVYRQGRQLKCVCTSPVHYLAADGELHFHGKTTVEFSVKPGCLRMLR